jgi:hypothetical protein
VTVLNSWALSNEQSIWNISGTLADAAELTRINKWIEDDLASAAGARFRVVLMHHPAYAMASDNVADRVLEHWEPLLAAGGVDLALVGHQHVYSRTAPLSGGAVDPDGGVTYVMGNAGLKYYDSADDTYSVKTIFNKSTYSVISVTGGTLALRTYDAAGTLLDSWTHESRVEARPCDRDGDGVVDGSDRQAVMDAILGGRAYDPDLDVNGDGAVDIRDAQAIQLAMGA